MQIRKQANKIELSDKTRKVNLNGSAVELDGLTVEESGEYEVGGVAVIYGDNAVLITFDDLNLAYIFKTAKPTKFEEDELNSADIVVFVDGVLESDKAAVSAILDAYDPKAVVFASPLETVKSLGESVKAEEVEAVKISKTLLPEEGCDYYALANA